MITSYMDGPYEDGLYHRHLHWVGGMVNNLPVFLNMKFLIVSKNSPIFMPLSQIFIIQLAWINLITYFDIDSFKMFDKPLILKDLRFILFLKLNFEKQCFRVNFNIIL